MNRRKNILITVLLIILFIFLFMALYVVNIYGDLIEKEPENLFADPASTITIRVVPINAFGWKIPLRKSKAEFLFIEGSNLVDIVEENKNEGYIILRSLAVPGRIELKVKSEFTLVPTLVVIEILTLTG